MLSLIQGKFKILGKDQEHAMTFIDTLFILAKTIRSNRKEHFKHAKMTAVLMNPISSL